MADNMDFSNAIEQLQTMLSSDDGQAQIQDIINMFGQNAVENTSAPSAPSDAFGGLDMNTIMKISSIIQTMNNDSNNPKTVFLNALKPFLKKNRQNKLEQASKLLKIANVLKAFNQKDQGGV
ncbi:MAG: hypothetical protein IJN96_02640 [Clostridia bacterium]|nr:hypothetical protein [Clostridia bacterium]